MKERKPVAPCVFWRTQEGPNRSPGLAVLREMQSHRSWPAVSKAGGGPMGGTGAMGALKNLHVLTVKRG